MINDPEFEVEIDPEALEVLDSLNINLSDFLSEINFDSDPVDVNETSDWDWD